MYVGDQHSLPQLGSGTTDTFTHCYSGAGRLALKRPQHQIVILEQIKPGPVDIGQLQP